MIRTDVVIATIFVPALFALLFLFSPTREGLRECPFYRYVIAAILSLGIGLRGFWKGGLSSSAVIAAVFCGTITGSANFLYFLLVVAFYVVGTKATRVGNDIKIKIFGDYKENPQRNWIQVFANVGWLTIIGLLQVAFVKAGEKTPLFTRLPVVFKFNEGTGIHVTPQGYIATFAHIAALGVVACSSGDTFASELTPVLSPNEVPVLFTKPWRRVPIGTNGGVTATGLIMSFLGGSLVGFVDYIGVLLLCSGGQGNVAKSYLGINYPRFSMRFLASAEWPLILIGGFAGFFGSLIDSFLGSTVQFSGLAESAHGQIVDRPGPGVKHISGVPLMDNHLVNMISSLITGIILPFCVFAILI